MPKPLIVSDASTAQSIRAEPGWMRTAIFSWVNTSPPDADDSLSADSAATVNRLRDLSHLKGEFNADLTG